MELRDDEVLERLLDLVVDTHTRIESDPAQPVNVPMRITPRTARAIDEGDEALRAIQLPAVNQLSVTEIVRLRDEARTALVHFRALLASRLDGRSNSGEFATDALVKELRIQAVEVERELRLLRRRGKGGDIGIATAALMFVIYGAVSHDPAIAATALVGALTTLATMHAGSKETIASTERLKDRAPYVLVHARQMLAHRGS